MSNFSSTMTGRRAFIAPLLVLLLVLSLSSPAEAQFGDSPARQAKFSAVFTPERDGVAPHVLVTANIDKGWHIFSLTQKDGATQKTEISLKPSADYELLGKFTTDAKIYAHMTKIYKVPLEEHSGTVVFAAPIKFREGVDPSQVTIEGNVTGQVCDDPGNVCVPFTHPISANLDSKAVAPVISATSNTGAKESLDTTLVDLAGWMGFAFLGGLILNIMPCVLPVIGLKIMSFVNQAGESRGRVFALNLWYSLGLISVFMVLAILADVSSQGWAEQFQSPQFGIALAAIVFIFALSLLGIWEIPIPGFVGSSKANDLASKEGPAGAFTKGILTTLLATPCTGPFMITTLSWAATQNAAVIYSTFFFMGLGMASPYLLIGAFPSLVRFLPKPGAWMETFKQLMGFVLLGTVVWIFTFIPDEYLVPTLGLIFGLWFACWWIGRTPLTAEFGEKAKAWMVAGLFSVVFGYASFWLLIPGDPWPPYREAELAKLREKGVTVMVDFTADW